MKERGERHSGAGNNVKVLELHDVTPKPEDLGITKITSSRWQQTRHTPRNSTRPSRKPSGHHNTPQRNAYAQRGMV